MNARITILDHLQFDTPTNQQKEALLAMSNFVKESNIDDFYILCGAAGTGKTSITTALIGYLNSREIEYKIAAPTGRAARILGRKSNTINSTIHSMIYNTKSDQETGVVTFELKRNDSNEFCVYIIDEASMIASKIQNESNELFKSKNSLLSDLIAFVKSGNKSNKIIFLGDKNQLPPINELESKALNEQYLKMNYGINGFSYLLTEVKRQEDGSVILKNAVNIRKAIDNNQNTTLQDVSKVSLNNALANYSLNFKRDGFDNVVAIGATHKMNTMFNKNVRNLIYGNNVKTIENGDLLLITSSWKRNGNQLYSGDHVIVKEVNLNNMEEVAGLHFVPLKLEVKNLKGESIIIEDYLLLESVLHPEGLKLEQENRLRHERFTKNKVYRESGNVFDDRYVGAIRATYGHSITCNKAQGGEWNTVYLNRFYVPSMKYLYTAVTRASQNLITF